MNHTTPIRANVVALKQMLNLIPRGMINRHAVETGVAAKARTFSVVSHLSAMFFAQFRASALSALRQNVGFVLLYLAQPGGAGGDVLRFAIRIPDRAPWQAFRVFHQREA